MACEKEETFVILREAINEIHFSGEINQKSISILIDRLLELETKVINKCKKLKRRYREDTDSDDENPTITFRVEPKPIKLFITSNGGIIYHVFSAIDTIRSMKIPVHTYVKGFAASAATLLSLAGKKRFITENSYMLIHEIRSGTWGKFTHLCESVENSKQLMEHIKNWYIKRTKLTVEELDEQLKKDICWNSQMCLEKGLVDEIIKF